MPHITIEYSANLEPKLEIVKLVEKVHAAAAATGVMELGGLRTRAARRDVYRVADGKPGNAFMFVVIRLRPNRSEEQRKMLGETVFGVVSKTSRSLVRDDGDRAIVGDPVARSRVHVAAKQPARPPARGGVTQGRLDYR